MLQRIFDFSYLTEKKEKEKNGEHSFYKENKKMQSKARRGYKLDSGCNDSGRYRGWKFFIVVWDGATGFGSVSKTKTRHNIVFVFFFAKLD